MRAAHACILALALSTAPWPAGAQEGQLVDRIAAVVNGEIITFGQLRRATVSMSNEVGGDSLGVCGVAGVVPATSSVSDAPTEISDRQVLQGMIDCLLMFQHVRRFSQFGVVPERIDAEYESLVAGFESRQAFEAEIHSRGLTPAEVRYDLERRFLIGNYIDARYRSVVDVREADLRRYYEEVLGPEMERQGAEMPPFETVDDEWIGPILIEAEVDRRVRGWIDDLRDRSEIVTYLW